MATSENRSPIRKIALVIGNGQYADGNNLPNAIHDAKDVAKALQDIDFDVDGPKLNLTYEQMEMTLTKFRHCLKNHDLALFYFSGHGTQWEVCSSK